MLLQVIINDNGTLLGVNKSSDEAAAFAQMITVGVCVCVCVGVLFCSLFVAIMRGFRHQMFYALGLVWGIGARLWWHRRAVSRRIARCQIMRIRISLTI